MTKGKLSIIVPSRNERFLQKTVTDLLQKATGEVEVIAVLDGYWPNPPLVEDKRLVQIHRGTAQGMRSAINAGVAASSGQWVMKCDAHCMFAEGYDRTLVEHADQDWLVVPRRKRLEPESWTIKDVGKPDVDYEFLSYPWWKPAEIGIHGTIWTDRALERKGPQYDIDEDMSFQGSCWMMSKRYFERVGPMQEHGYGTFIGEPQELGLKVWLSGGKQVRNKLTWYAHLHKGSTYGRGYSLDKKELVRGNLYSVSYWVTDQWEKRVRDFEWLVEHFWPVPSWPENWREEMAARKHELTRYLV